MTKVKNTIFHYTTLSGFLGIVQEDCLFASDIRFLNDRTEFQYGFDQVKIALMRSNLNIKVVDEAGKEKKLDPAEGKKGSEFIVGVASLVIKQIYEHITHSNYVFSSSFCKSRNVHEFDRGVLSQWRAYGSDGGVAVGFDLDEIKKFLSRFFSHVGVSGFAFEDVVYCDSGKKMHTFIQNEIQQFFDRFKPVLFALLDTARKAKKPDGNSVRSPMESIARALDDQLKAGRLNEVLSLAGHFARVPALLKHPSFHEEKELRMLAWSASESERATLCNQILFRSSGSILVPYIRLSGIGKMPISRVIVGPHPEQQRRCAAIQLCLERQGQNCEVVASEIPIFNP